jgi:HemY protein
MFVYIILTVLAAGWFGNLIIKDAGYVLLSYDGASLQTSLWVFLGVMVIVLGLVLGLWHLLRALLRSAGAWTNWRTQQRLSKAHDHTSKGLTSLIEGHWQRAQNYLLRGIDDSALPLVNYLGAARAAQEQGDIQKRDELIQKARERVDGSELALGISLASFQMEIEAWEQAASTLLQLQRNDLVLELLVKVYSALKDWPSCKELLPELKKNVSKDRYAELEELTWRSLFKQLVVDDAGSVTEEALNKVRQMWKEMPAALKKDSEMQVAYASCLVKSGSRAEAEEFVRKALKSQWQESLVDFFGTLVMPNPGNQIKTAEAWLQKYPDNPRVLRCIGMLYVHSGELESARDHLEKSLAIRRDRDTCIALGKVMAGLGDHVRSNQLYLMAMAEEETAGRVSAAIA